MAVGSAESRIEFSDLGDQTDLVRFPRRFALQTLEVTPGLRVGEHKRARQGEHRDERGSRTKMSQVPNDEANLVARLASPDPAERWRAIGDIYTRFFNDVRRITLKWQGRRLSTEEATDIAQEAFEKFTIRVVHDPFVADKIWGVREYILVAARRLVVKRLKKPDPGAAQRKELHLPRLGGDADGGSGGEPPTRWTSPVAADADSTDLVGESRG